MIKKTYKIKGMHCTSCAMLIEGELEDIGVKACCNYTKQIVDAEYDPDKTTEDSIIKTIQKAGYSVGT